MKHRSLIPSMTNTIPADPGSTAAKEVPPRSAGIAVRRMMQIRLFLLVEAATFVAAALVHFGVFIGGYEHGQAAVAESVIAAVLLTGLTSTWAARTRTRSIGLAAQAFALLGTIVGVFTIAVGVGPRTVPDVAYHGAILAVLVWGLVVARRTPAT